MATTMANLLQLSSSSLALSNKNKCIIYNVVCFSLMITLILGSCSLSESSTIKVDRTPLVGQTAAANNNKIRHHNQQQHQLPSSAYFDNQYQIQLQQRLVNSEEYENLNIKEEEAIKNNGNSERQQEQTETVVPSKETNGNSQVVYVNLARVVNEPNKTETTRLVGNNAQLIKQDGQISCGETNRNGKPSMVVPSAPESILNRIVGGNKADPGEFPFQVRLNIRSRRGTSLCGGVIIDQRHILTAAHCMTTW